MSKLYVDNGALFRQLPWFPEALCKTESPFNSYTSFVGKNHEFKLKSCTKPISATMHVSKEFQNSKISKDTFQCQGFSMWERVLDFVYISFHDLWKAILISKGNPSIVVATENSH